MYNETREVILEESTFQVIITLIDDLATRLEELGQDMSDLEYELNVLFSYGGRYNPNAYNEMKENLYLFNKEDEGIEYTPQAVLSLSNFGGMSVMLDPEDGDYLYYQWYKEKPVRTQIMHVDDSETGDTVSAFFLPTGEVFRLDEFMRVGY